MHLLEIAADSKLITDLYVDDPEGLQTLRALSNNEAIVADSSPKSTATSGTVDIADAELARTFTAINGMIREDIIQGINALYIFDLKGLMHILALLFLSVESPYTNTHTTILRLFGLCLGQPG